MEELLEQENEVVTALKFRLRYPTINSWATWLCNQWDAWAESKEAGVRFRAADSEVLIFLYRVTTTGDG